MLEDNATEEHDLVKTELSGTSSCRICLIETDCQNIFELNYEGQDVVDVYSFCTNIKLIKELHNPEYFCLSCITELIQAYEFISKCRTSHEFLLSIPDVSTENVLEVNNVIIKPEEEIYIEVIDKNPTESDRNKTLEEKTHQAKEIKQVNCYKCLVCLKEFTTSAGLKNHSKTHEKEITNNPEDSKKRKNLDGEVKQLKSGRKCPKCSKEFSTIAGLKIHYRSHANGTTNSITCKICGKTLVSRKNIARHMLIHTGDKPFRCQECDRGFRQKHSLQTHMMLHTGERPVVCEFCAQTFKQVKDLKYHHNKGDCTLLNHNKSNPTSCNICLAPAKSYRALRQHYSLAHSKKEYLCNECGKGFISAAGLKQHLQTHTGDRPYVCKVCDKRFLQKHSLKYHMFIHTGERPHRCEICGKSFVQHHHLTIHTRLHSGYRPYSCQICSKSFTMKGNLTVHIRTHTGETPYVCDVCDAGFHDSSSLKKHKVKHDMMRGVAKVKKSDKVIDLTVE